MPFRARPRRFLCCKSRRVERRAETQTDAHQKPPSIRQSPKKDHPFVISLFWEDFVVQDRWLGWFPRSAVRLCDFRVRRESAVILDFRIRLHVNCCSLHVTEFISSRGEKGSPLQFRNRRRSHHSQHNPLRIRPRRDANGTPPPHPSLPRCAAHADGCAATGTQSASLRPHWITHRPTAHPASHLPRRTAEEASPST